MTIDEVATALCANAASVRHYIEELCGMGLVIRTGMRKPVAMKPRVVWKVA
jgi:hypothetical protein